MTSSEERIAEIETELSAKLKAAQYRQTLNAYFVLTFFVLLFCAGVYIFLTLERLPNQNLLTSISNLLFSSPQDQKIKQILAWLVLGGISVFALAPLLLILEASFLGAYLNFTFGVYLSLLIYREYGVLWALGFFFLFHRFMAAFYLKDRLSSLDKSLEAIDAKLKYLNHNMERQFEQFEEKHQDNDEDEDY